MWSLSFENEYFFSVASKISSTCWVFESFSKSCVFGELSHCLRVDGRPKIVNIYKFSKIRGYAKMGPKI